MNILVIMEYIALPLSYLYPERLCNVVKDVYKYIYSAKIKRKIRSCGRLFRVLPHISFKGGKYMQLGENFRARHNLVLECYDKYENQEFCPYLQIGDNAYLGDNCHIGCINRVVIGDNLLTGSNVYITDHFHGKGILEEADTPPIKRNLHSRAPVYIGNNVWLGNNVVIVPGVKIGNNVTVGANAVVTKSLPDNSIAVGVPAKVLRIKN